MKLNNLQRIFITTACNLKEVVIQFDISDEEFLDDYGFTKEDILKAIEELRQQLWKQQ